MITDKSVIIQIIGSLMKKPLLLSDTKYSLTPDDFYNNLEKYIFGAIYNLYSNGAEKINVIDIDSYLQNHQGIYSSFQSHNGIQFLQDCEEISVLENFDYYYNKLKKYNLLNDLEKMGYDTTTIYPKDILMDRYDEKIEKFETMTVQNIFDEYRLNMSSLEAKYECNNDISIITADTNIRQLLDNLKKAPDVGSPLQGKIYNTAVRGARRGMYYIRSADSGVGKTRSMAGEAANLAYPFKYNTEKMQWELTGSCEKVIYIGTEQKVEEIQTLILAFLTGINEEKIMYGLQDKNEEEVLNQAIQIMEVFKNNLIICQIPDPDIKAVKALIRKNVLQYDASCVFYDYIFTSPGLMREFKEARLREDVLLMMFSTALKDLAVELNVFLQTSTQVTINENERTGMKTKASIRGAKSIADKADVGCVVSLVTDKDKEALASIVENLGYMPNQVTDIYKLRRGRFNNCRIWSFFDLGTCRKIDLLITDSSMNPIQCTPIQPKINFENAENIYEFLTTLNGYKMDNETGEVEEIEEKEIIEEPQKVEEVVQEIKNDWSQYI